MLGITIGIGIGFRQDMLILTPLAALTVLLFANIGPGLQLAPRLIALATLLLCYLAAGYPILKQHDDRGKNSGHVIALGHAEVFDRHLGLGGADYSFDQHYKDSYAFAKIVNVDQHAAPVRYQTKEYDAATTSYLLDEVSLIPADWYDRFLAVVRINLSTSPFMKPAADNIFKNSLIKTLFDLRVRWLSWTAFLLPFLALLSVYLLAQRSLRVAIFACMVVAYLSAYSTLQYRLRHVFHLEVMHWVILFGGGALLYQGLLKLKRKRFDSADLMRQILSPSGLLMLSVLLLPLAVNQVLEEVQRQRLSRHLGAIANDWARTAIAFDEQSNAGKVLYTAAEFELGERELHSATASSYFAATFVANSSFPVTLRYLADHRSDDFSSTYQLRPDENGFATLFFPVYYSSQTLFFGSWQFAGLEVAGQAEARLDALERLHTVPGKLTPIFLGNPDSGNLNLNHRLPRPIRLTQELLHPQTRYENNECASIAERGFSGTVRAPCRLTINRKLLDEGEYEIDVISSAHSGLAVEIQTQGQERIQRIALSKQLSLNKLKRFRFLVSPEFGESLVLVLRPLPNATQGVLESVGINRVSSWPPAIR